MQEAWVQPLVRELRVCILQLKGPACWSLVGPVQLRPSTAEKQTNKQKKKQRKENYPFTFTCLKAVAEVFLLG